MKESAEVTLATKRICKKPGLPGVNDFVKHLKENLYLGLIYNKCGMS